MYLRPRGWEAPSDVAADSNELLLLLLLLLLFPLLP